MIRSLMLSLVVGGLTFTTLVAASAQHYGQRSSGFGLSLNYGSPHGYRRSRYTGAYGGFSPCQTRTNQRFLPARFTGPTCFSPRPCGAWLFPRYGCEYSRGFGCGYGGGY